MPAFEVIENFVPADHRPGCDGPYAILDPATNCFYVWQRPTWVPFCMTVDINVSDMVLNETETSWVLTTTETDGEVHHVDLTPLICCPVVVPGSDNLIDVQVDNTNPRAPVYTVSQNLCNAADGGVLVNGQTVLACTGAGLQRLTYQAPTIPDPCAAATDGALVDQDQVLVCTANGLRRRQYTAPVIPDPCAAAADGNLQDQDQVLVCTANGLRRRTFTAAAGEVGQAVVTDNGDNTVTVTGTDTSNNVTAATVLRDVLVNNGAFGVSRSIDPDADILLTEANVADGTASNPAAMTPVQKLSTGALAVPTPGPGGAVNSVTARLGVENTGTAADPIIEMDIDSLPDATIGEVCAAIGGGTAEVAINIGGEDKKFPFFLPPLILDVPAQAVTHNNNTTPALFPTGVLSGSFSFDLTADPNYCSSYTHVAVALRSTARIDNVSTNTVNGEMIVGIGNVATGVGFEARSRAHVDGLTGFPSAGDDTDRDAVIQFIPIPAGGTAVVDWDITTQVTSGTGITAGAASVQAKPIYLMSMI